MKLRPVFHRWQYVLWLCCSISLGQTANTFDKRFSVFRVAPVTEAERQLLSKVLGGVTEADVWMSPASTKKDVTFRIPAQEKRIIEDLIHEGMVVNDITAKIQRLVDELDSTYLSESHKRNISSLDLNVYHTFDVISMWLHDKTNRCPENLCEIITIGQSYEGRPLEVMKVGNYKNPVVFLECGIHAREWISPAVCLKIIHFLVEGYEKNDPDAVDILENFIFYILPVTNPDGYEYTHTTERLWRKTRRPNSDIGSSCYGTDPNRNWGMAWGGEGSSSDPCSQIYRGPVAFSESETQAVKEFVEGFAPNVLVYLGIHSYGQHILIPWGYDNLYPADFEEMFDVANAISFGIWQTNGLLYSVGQSYGIMGATSGSSDDWAKGKAGIKFSYTLEVRDVDYYGFLLPASQIHSCAREVYNGILSMGRRIKQKQYHL